ncbi:helix-turn-helix transcriptional regulator [Qipengyuania sp. XHP0207]|uniref:helix-turn-helix domain-containing protein n=1 Tax=Qipengyuania sp. XHP0207 TaxID=3038078 RepID=UPI0024200BAB|nr:helix-turn-helix transcriptional regulator [Qipengyuania sp. XHP0207]MDG5748211.1 helix-turn-helix transcriptional regulator [Qipengyuania sp. XHP0207]
MSGECHIEVRFFAPPADIAPCFTMIYHMTVDVPAGETVTDCLVPEWANMRFFSDQGDLAGSLRPNAAGAQRFQATGPSAQPTPFEIGRARMWGLALSPIGWARFIGRRAADYVNVASDGEEEAAFAPFVPLCDIFCAGAANPDAQLAKAMQLLRDTTSMPRDAARIAAVHDAMGDAFLTKVEDFAARVRMSKRTLERICRQHFGFSPRVLLRRQRLVRVLTAYMIEQRRWTSVMDLHYHDQAHFVREFKHFMDMSPSEYAAMPHPVMSAFLAERQRVWGLPVRKRDNIA